MKKLIISLLIVVSLGMIIYYFSKDDTVPITKDDKITLVFDYNITGHLPTITTEMRALLTKINTPNISDPHTLLTEQSGDNSIIFYLPQGSLKYSQKTQLEKFLKDIITTYNKINFNTEQAYKIKFDTEIKPLPFDESKIPLLITDNKQLAHYQQELITHAKHYELLFKLAKPYTQTNMLGQTNCLIEFKTTDEPVPYKELTLGNYLSDETKQHLPFANYKQILMANNIAVTQGELLKNLMQNNPSLKFILLPSQENPLLASLYLYYGQATKHNNCTWPNGLPMQKTIYEATPFAFLLGYQIYSLY